MFVKYYIECGNSGEAYVRAGYKRDKPAIRSWELLKKPKIQAYLQAEASKTMKRQDITVDRVIQEIAKIAFMDPRRLFNEDGDIKPIHELDESTAAAIASVDVMRIFGEQEGKLKKVRLHDKLAALTQLGRTLGIFQDNVKIAAEMDDRELLKIAENVTKRANGTDTD